MTFTKFTSSVLSISGTLLASYVGIWIFLVGGASDIMHSFSPFKAGLFSFGLGKVLTCDIAFLIIFALFKSVSNWVEVKDE